MKQKLQMLIVILLLMIQNVLADKQSNVTTPNGTTVIAWIFEEASASDLAYIENQIALQYPRAQKMAPASRTYNCHGYAWHMTEGGSARWIGVNSTAHEDVYMTDGSYTEVTSGTSPRKVSYQSDDHSAVTTDELGQFISKWGNLPLMRHASGYSPYNASVLHYYVKTSLIEIQGSDVMAINKPTTYSLSYTPVSPITWSVPSNVQIISGQGTATVTVKAINLEGNGMISVKMGNNNASIFKKVAVGVPDIDQISVSIAGSSNMLYAYHTNRNECIASYSGVGDILEYEWEANGWEVFNPLTLNKSKIYLKATTLPANSKVNIRIRARNTVGWSSVKLIGADVNNSMSSAIYKINTSSNRNITIIKNEGYDNLIKENSVCTINQDLIYYLYNSFSGMEVLKGTISREGGIIDLTNLPNGIYIFSLHIDKNLKQTMRIAINH